MQLRILTLTLAGLTVSLTSLFYLLSGNVLQSDAPEPAENIAVPLTQERADLGLPVRIRIPAINADALIEHVGVTPQGEMDIPKGPTSTAWYAPGPRPGEEGSAVIAGHFGWKNDIPAIFDDLHKLKKGDKIYIEDEAGATITFVVRGSRVYTGNENAADVFGSADGGAHLNLVTCQGTWNKAKKSYSNRLVVFADKEI